MVLGLVAACSTESSDGSSAPAPGATVTEPGPNQPAPPAPPPPSTQPDAGGKKTCNNAEECGDVAKIVCDPVAHQCVAGQCGPSAGGKACAADQLCIYQAAGTAVGACYPRCAPFTSGGCAPDSECVIGKYDGSEGYCKPRGTTAADAACPPNDTATGCVAGYVCIVDPINRFCREQCDFFGAQKECSAADRPCTPPGVCTGDRADPAALGQDCGASAQSGTLCGLSGKKLLGVCAGTQQNPTHLICSKWCRMKDNDCPGSQACQPTGVPSVGYCQ